MCLVGGVFPALSPDAEAVGPVEAQKPQRPLVSVIREGAVWVLQAEGRFAPVPKTEGADRAIFSPDGRFLAVHRSEGSLWLTTPDGRKGWLLAKDRVSPDMAWSPTGGRLGYIRSGALWVIPCGPEGPSDWSLAAPEAERFAWSSDGNRLYVATPAWSVPAPPKPTTPIAPRKPESPPGRPGPDAGTRDTEQKPGDSPGKGGHEASAATTNGIFPSPALGKAAGAAGTPVRRQAVRILEVKWRGGTPKVWGELPLRMVEDQQESTAVRHKLHEPKRAEGIRVYDDQTPSAAQGSQAPGRSGWPVWGVEGIYPSPGGEAVALVVRDAPDSRRALHRGLISFTDRSAIPLVVWQARLGSPLEFAGWTIQDRRLWIGFLTDRRRESGHRTEGRSEAFEGEFLAWKLPEGAVSSVDRPVILTPETATDRRASSDPQAQGWLVVRAFAHPWIQERWRPASLWAVRPDGRAIQLSHPLFGAEDLAGWWGPGEQWVGLRKAWDHARLWWSSRPLGRTEVLVDGLGRDVAPGVVDIGFVHPGPDTGTWVTAGAGRPRPTGRTGAEKGALGPG
ncbi:hypothetical protein [Kyrpidia spormannii]|uniref:hypothetical protein n=1 Tax=Kyrpidia spormannii TaxID=2055160 RepID=UPI001055F4AD|nr:hypothetical protein [Kyrpidia spormannii]